jgi:hypothetical protein
MATIDDVEIPSLLFDDQGSDPATPASGFSRIYTKADGAYHIDDAGAVTGPFAAAAGAGGIVDYAEEFFTGGDIAITSTSTGAAVPSLTPLTLNGTAGDIVYISVITRCSDSDAQSIRVDISLAGGATRFVSSRTSTASSLGVPGWFVAASSAAIGITGGVYMPLVANDLSAGVCTITLCAWLSGAGSRPFMAGTNGDGLYFQAVNFGAP